VSDPATMTLPFLIAGSSRIIEALLAREMQGGALTLDEITVLVAYRDLDDPTLMKLEVVTGLEVIAIARIANRLRKRGFLASRRRDMRSGIVGLTDSGGEALKESLAALDRVSIRFLAGLTPSDAATLTAGLARAFALGQVLAINGSPGVHGHTTTDGLRQLAVGASVDGI